MFPLQRLRYEKQIKALHLFRLLSLEMLHRRVEIEKQHFRKKVFSCNSLVPILPAGHREISLYCYGQHKPLLNVFFSFFHRNAHLLTTEEV